MLGHTLWRLSSQRHDTYGTLRLDLASARWGRFFDAHRVVEGVAADDVDSVVRAVALAKPDVVVNCIGIIKQRPSAQDPVASIGVNALFPHRLARLCRARGSRLIHISTDCVFSGSRGRYTEHDVADAADLYGRSKLLGEVDEVDCITLRTSIIGRELAGSFGLLEWFLDQRGKAVRGYRRALFSGLTTPAFAALILSLIEAHPDLSGVWHVASAPISKYDLLCAIRDALALDISIEPDDSLVVDRTLDDSRFRVRTGLPVPTWAEMIEPLAYEETPYDSLRGAPG